MSAELKVLLLTHGTPFPVRSGGHMYTANVIRTLTAREDIDLTVIAIGTADSLQHAPSGATWYLSSPRKGNGSLRGFLGKYPRSTAATISRNYRRHLRNLLSDETWDAILIDYIMIGWVLDDVVKMTERQRTRIVYVSHNVESTLRMRIAEGYRGPIPLRWAAIRDAQKAMRLEGRIVRSATLVSAETEEDANEFRRLFDAARIHIYTPGYDGRVVASRQVHLRDTSRNVAVIGSRIATMKRLVLDELLSSVASTLQQCRIGLLVAGEAPSDYLAAKRDEYPYIEFLGYVDDIASLLASVRLGLITDHIGGGFKHRILTLVFNRVPIIATSQVMAGLPLTPDVDYVDVAGNEDAARVVSDVIDDVERLDAMQNNAFEACKQTFDWNTTTDAFVTALRAAPVEVR